MFFWPARTFVIGFPFYPFFLETRKVRRWRCKLELFSARKSYRPERNRYRKKLVELDAKVGASSTPIAFLPG